MNSSSDAIIAECFDRSDGNEANTLSVALHRADDAWKPSVLSKSSLDKKEELRRSIQGILNKLTIEKFEILVAQLKRLKFNTEEELDLVTELIFGNALCEPFFSSLYANLCSQVCMLKVPKSDIPGQNVNLRKTLLTKCQKEFEIENISHDSLDEDRRWRQRRVSYMRFIGELLNVGQLIAPVICVCIDKLLAEPDETSLECVCQLLITSGKMLDNPTNTSQLGEMNKYFTQIQNIVDGRLTSTRIRFMLQDVIDLRKNNWIPRRIVDSPKSIEELHKEILNEASI